MPSVCIPYQLAVYRYCSYVSRHQPRTKYHSKGLYPSMKCLLTLSREVSMTLIPVRVEAEWSKKRGNKWDVPLLPRITTYVPALDTSSSKRPSFLSVQSQNDITCRTLWRCVWRNLTTWKAWKVRRTGRWWREFIIEEMRRRSGFPFLAQPYISRVAKGLLEHLKSQRSNFQPYIDKNPRPLFILRLVPWLNNPSIRQISSPRYNKTRAVPPVALSLVIYHR